MKKIIKYLSSNISKNKRYFSFMIIIFLIGLIFGSLFINFINIDDKNLLLNQIHSYFLAIKDSSKEVLGIKAFTSSLISNYIELIIIFILGLSIIGILAVIFILFFKGFMLGTTLSAILLSYKLKGIVLIAVYIFPCVIINILIYIYLCYYAIIISKEFIYLLLKKEKINPKTFLGKYVLSFIISIIIMGFNCLLESYLISFLLKIIANMFKL